MPAERDRVQQFDLRLSRRRILAASAGGVGAVSLLSACGRRSGATSRSSRANSAGQQKPLMGGQFNPPHPADPYNFDPIGDPGSNGIIAANTNDGLLDVKTGNGIKYTDVVIEPGLADRWETPDAQTYTFHLHPGARYANLPPVNGREVTSADVKFSYEYLSRTGQFANAKPASAVATYFSGLDRVETPDPQTVSVRFQSPFSPFLTYAAFRQSTPILAHEIYDQDRSFSKRSVGTGPWQLDASASQEGQHWVLRRNPTYFMAGKPYLDTVQYLIMPDAASQLAAFQGKQLDLLRQGTVPNNAVAQLQKQYPQAVSTPVLASAGGYLFENTRKPPLDDIRVRRAIAFAIDRDAFIKAFANGQGEWAAAGGVPDLFTQDELRKLEPHDPAQAKQLLSAAGYANGIDLELIYTAGGGSDQMLNIDQLIQAQLKEVGINVTLKGLDKATYASVTRASNYQINWESKNVQGDVDMYLYYTFFSTAVGNYDGFKDPTLDQLILQQRQEFDAAKRRGILRQAVQRIVDQSWGIAFFYGQTYTFTQPYVKNFGENSLFSFAQAFDTWIAK